MRHRESKQMRQTAQGGKFMIRQGVEANGKPQSLLIVKCLRNTGNIK